jgi:methyl-accepting chemotaxis protein
MLIKWHNMEKRILMGIKNLNISTKFILSVIVLSVVLMVINIFLFQYFFDKSEKETYIDTKNKLIQNTTDRVGAKYDVGISNAVSIANDLRIIDALKSNNRELAINALGDLSSKFKAQTPFKNIKVHIHTSSNKSFVRGWKVNKYGDDLSSFRHSVVKVNSTKSVVNTIEVGKAGLSVRSVVPIADSSGHLGSLEFIQGLNSVAKVFDKNKENILVLMNRELSSIAKFADTSKSSGNYILSQKFYNKEFFNDSKNIDYAKLLKDGYYASENYFYTYKYIEDFKKDKLGIYLVGKDISYVKKAVEHSQVIGYIAFGILSVIVFTLLLLNFINTKFLVLNPIKQLNNTILDLMNNNSNSKIEIIFDDEIGEVSRNFNAYLEKIEDGIHKDNEIISEVSDIVKTVNNGYLDQRVTKTSSNPTIQKLTTEFNDMLEILSQNIARTVGTLKEYEQHNYIVRNGINCEGDLCQLMKGVNSLASSITDILVENKKYGLLLNRDAEILAKNVSELNSAISQQSVSITETSRSLEDILENIKDTTDKSLSMSQLATDTKESAFSGIELANSTASAMEEINNSTNQINESIEAIDQIAFQTNILSLNAAVEAATAGEAGKGFAVVAGEVRNLASRSTEVAKDIKELVGSAQSKAKEGKDKSTQMIDGFNELNEKITQTTTLIDDVTNASKEQMSSINNISTQMTQLDASTKHSAEVSENANNIASQTKDIAKTIVNSVETKEFLGKNDIVV